MQVHLNGKIINLKEGNSIDIPSLSEHFIANETESKLIIIEIQMGSYFGEDDIIRINDTYNRKLMYNILQDKIKYLIVHCSDTNDDFTIEDIHKMHLDFGWDGIGYHKVIDQKGKVYNGRPEYWTEHIKGFNNKSLGVCLIEEIFFQNN